nr:hypothetical protein [Tanacetum cinerariifolium]
MQKIIKEQVKEQVKVQVSKILLKIEQTVNEQLEAEVLTRSSNSSKTSYVVAADLSEMELKKILIEKIEGNKSIHRSAEEPLQGPYVAMMMLIKMKNPSLDQTGGLRDVKKERSQSQQAFHRRKLPGALASQHKGLNLDKRADDQLILEPSHHPEWFSQQKKPPTPYHNWNKTLSAAHGSIQPWISDLAKLSDSRSSFNELMDTPKKPPTPYHNWNKTLSAAHGSIQPWISDLAKLSDSRSSFNELMDTPVDFFAFLMNRLKVDSLTPELLVGPTYELMKGSCKSLVELEFFLEEVYKTMTYQLDWVNLEGQQYPHNLLKPLPLIPNNRGCHVIPFDHFINNGHEYLRGGASSHKYTTYVTKTKAADYGHIKWIEDLVPRTMWIQEPIGYDKHALWGKLTNLTVKEHFAFNVSLRMLMRIDELHKFSDGTLTDVRTALDDHLKGIRMQYLPKSILRKSDKDRAATMIQAIDKRLKTRRIMRILERFVGGRLYEGDFRMLQRTI